MAVRFSEAVPRGRELAYEPSERWVRALVGDGTVVDTRRPLVVWPKGHVVPIYAAPRADVHMEALPRDAVVPLDDTDLADHVGLRFEAFDRWLEEDEEIVGHPRDPFHRVDVRPSSRHVVVELDGFVLAECRRPALLFETGLPTRFYLPREDLLVEARDGERRTVCAYKGQATYLDLVLGGSVRAGLAWTYPDPLIDARPIAGLVAFHDEKVDMTLDGERRERPVTQWS